MSQLPSRPAVISFDLDDTLVDTTGTIAARVRHAANFAVRGLGRPLTEAEIEHATHAVMTGDPDERFPNLLKAFGVAPGTGDDERLIAAYGERTLELLRPTADAERVVSTLAARYRLAVLTNGEDRLQRDKLERTRLSRYFDLVLTSEQLGLRKPAAGAFLAVSTHFDVKPIEVVHVGDSVVNDVAGAAAAGMYTVLLKRAPWQPRLHNPVIPTVEITELRDLLTLFSPA